MSTHRKEFTILTFEELPSTNDYIKENIIDFNKDFTIVQCRNQTGGRGRFSRTWTSSPDKDLTFSFLFRPDFDITLFPVLPLLTGLALFRVLNPGIPEGLQLKWPNDLLWRGNKLAGILCELIRGERDCAIIGIGLNVNSTEFPGLIETNPVSLKAITGRDFNIPDLMKKITSECRKLFTGRHIPLSEKIIDEWMGASSCRGSRVLFQKCSVTSEGTVSSIDPQGRLIITDNATGRDIACTGEVEFL